MHTYIYITGKSLHWKTIWHCFLKYVCYSRKHFPMCKHFIYISLKILEYNLALSCEYEHVISYNPVIFLLGINPSESLTRRQQKIYMSLFIAAIVFKRKKNQ